MDFSKTRKSPILLQEVNRRYALDPLRPMRGFVRLEYNGDKGLLTVIAENIRAFPDGNYVYKLLLAGVRKERPRYHLVGSMSGPAAGSSGAAAGSEAPAGAGDRGARAAGGRTAGNERLPAAGGKNPPTAKGRMEGSFSLDPGNLDGRGSCLWDFDTVIVAAASTVNQQEPLHPVLQGKFQIARPAGPHRTAAPKDYSPFYNDFVLERCIAIAGKQRQLADIRPFARDATSAHWKKVLEWADFPILSPGAEAPVKAYGHFLWGWNETHYFVAVPGRFLPAEQPDGGKSGFAFWQPILGMEQIQQDTSMPLQQRREQTYGYWIASISRRNGKVEEYPYKG